MSSIKIITFAFFILPGITAKAQQKIDTTAIINSIFTRGEKMVSNNNFSGTVWLKRFVSPADSLNCIVSLVTFSPGVRTNWHIHPGGQILIVTEGIGYCQEKGKPRQILHKGDVVKCPRGAAHWHGAAPNSEFAHLVFAPTMIKARLYGCRK